MKKVWQHKYIFSRIVVELALTLRAATKDDLDSSMVTIKNLIKKLPTHFWRRYKNRELSQINMVVVHHSATTDGSAESYARYHVGKGWPGIGYHFVIDKDGTVNQTNDLESISYHVSGHNTRSIGICLTGDYDKQTPPDIQFENCAKLIVSLQQQLGKELDIRSHSAFSNKTCPGLNINMEDIVKKVTEYT